LTVNAMLTSASCDYDNVIVVLVGPKEHRFIAHKDVICADSKFFKAACSDRWREGQEKIVRLPEARSKRIFQKYMDWSYTHELELDTVMSDDDTVMSDEIRNKTVDQLVELYLLGDILDDVRLRNKVLQTMNSFVCEQSLVLGPEMCHLIWEHTSLNSPLRKWTFDATVSLLSPHVFELYGMEWPAEIILHVAVTFMKMHADEEVDTEGLTKRLGDYIEETSDG
jgi:hypothetical protein